MSIEKPNITPSKKVSQKKVKTPSFSEILDGSAYQVFFQNNMMFLLFLGFLVFFYMTNRYRYEKTIQQVEVLRDEITRLKYQQITISSKMMSISKPSQVEKMVEDYDLGLKFSSEPPIVLED
jgi:hypothetical protein